MGKAWVGGGGMDCGIGRVMRVGRWFGLGMEGGGVKWVVDKAIV